MRSTALSTIAFAAAVLAHGDHSQDQSPISGPHQGLWYNTLPGDGGTQVSLIALLSCGNNAKSERATDALRQ